MKRRAKAFWRMAAYLFLASAPTAYAWAQPPAPPTVPDTNVEATPTVPETTVQATPYNPDYFQDPGMNDPIIAGDKFHAPAITGYNAQSSTTGSIVAMDDRDIAGTVNTISRDLMNDQLDLRFQDIARNAPGVIASPDPGGLFPDRIFIRGFQLGSRDFRKDGFIDPTYVPRDFQNVERVEILQGPASTLYGSSSPSGLVNVITKKPLETNFNTAGFTYGAYNQARFTLDSNGFATKNGNVFYRVNVAQEDMQNYRNFGFLSRTLIAPSFTWKIDDDTRLTYLAEYHRDHRRPDQGIPAIGGNPLALPSDTYAGQPGNDFIHYAEFRQTLMLDHQINEDWSWRIGGNSLFYQFPGTATGASGNPIPGVFPDVPPPLFYQSRNNILFDNENSQSAIANIAGVFDTGGFTHNVLLGAEYIYFDSASAYSFGTLPPIDLSNPVYTNPPAIPLGAAAFPSYRQQREGIYFQDQVTLTNKWQIVGGVRVDNLDLNFDRTTFFGPPVTINTNDNFNRVSPRGGVIYQPFADNTMSVYYNYSRSFSPPNSGIYLNTNALAPITGQQHELGIKTRLLENLSLNAAGFYATRENADLNTSAFFLTQIGMERSQGAEVSLIGNINQRTSVVANYTYVDVLLSDPTNPLFNGTQQRNIPHNSANLWARYNWIQNDVHTFGTALGMIYLDTRAGDLGSTFFLPAINRWDAGVFYNRGRFVSTAYIENLFNTNYALASTNAFQVIPGAPLNARANVGWTW
jgi:iron complex outermembrane receptor protein